MMLIIGVRFRKSGKVYYFDPADLDIEKGAHVIVETVRGIEYGTVVLAPKSVSDEKVVQPLKPVIRMATKKDDEINLENIKKEKEAFDICVEKIRKHGLEMKLIDSEYTFDRNKLLFYFTADGRIDFRELVKDLASIFRTRIELRQIGVRDETKLMGGIGICGRTLCCHAYLSDFAPVSIKMAKEQNLSLNPAKISGMCGRLMCCLKNEEEAYEYLKSTLPRVNAAVRTVDGFEGVVQSVGILKQQVKVIITKDNDEKEIREYHVDELAFDKNSGMGGTVESEIPVEEVDENDLKELEAMEHDDIKDLLTEKEQEKPRGKNAKKQRRPDGVFFDAGSESGQNKNMNYERKKNGSYGDGRHKSFYQSNDVKRNARRGGRGNSNYGGRRYKG